MLQTEIQRQSQRRLKWYGAGPYRAGARGKIRRMACKVMDGLQREFKAAQEKYAQFGYETYRSVRGVSEHKAKQLVREAKEEMAVLRGRMSLHRATCAACKR